MRIGINILYLIPGKVGGTETYARELIPLLSKEDELVIFCGKESANIFRNLHNTKVVTLPIHSENRLARMFAEQFILPWLCIKHRIDVIFSLGYSAPLLHHCPSVVTIHDLNWYYHPEDFSRISVYLWKYLTIMSANSANLIIAISNATKHSLINIVGINPNKIEVIYHGSSDYTVVQNAYLKKVSKKYSLPNNYLFTVLSHYPHKNIETLIGAYKEVRKEFDDIYLVIAGTGTTEASQERKRYVDELNDNHIIALPYVATDELQAMYRMAKIFVFPSLYEGFGLPVLEAMKNGVPVISSSAFSLREIVSDYGILVDPKDIEGFEKNIKKLLKNRDLRERYIAMGKDRASQFSWPISGKKTLDLVRLAYATK